MTFLFCLVLKQTEGIPDVTCDTSAKGQVQHYDETKDDPQVSITYLHIIVHTVICTIFRLEHMLFFPVLHTYVGRITAPLITHVARNNMLAELWKPIWFNYHFVCH